MIYQKKEDYYINQKRLLKYFSLCKDSWKEDYCNLWTAPAHLETRFESLFISYWMSSSNKILNT
jgi:hypothetical protein